MYNNNTCPLQPVLLVQQKYSFSSKSFSFSFSAEEWTLKFFQGHFPGKDVRCSWLSSLLNAGAFVAHNDTSRLLRVVASAEYAFLALEASVQKMEDGTNAFVCKPSLAGLGWHHVVSLQDWLVLDTTPCLQSPETGPVCWRQSLVFCLASFQVCIVKFLLCNK